MIKHVWFDLAGTLYQETGEYAIMHDNLRYQTYAKVVGQNDPIKAAADFDILYAKHKSNDAVFRALGKPVGFWQNVFDNLDYASILKPNPVISETVAAVADLLPISLFSNFRHDQISLVLDTVKIPESSFTNIISGEDIKNRKPALDGFYKMIELSGVSADEILFIGDRIGADIEPANEVGIVTCLVWQASEIADYSAVKFSDIKDIVLRLTTQ